VDLVGVPLQTVITVIISSQISQVLSDHLAQGCLKEVQGLTEGELPEILIVQENFELRHTTRT
jgi:hypothetical protein